MPLITRAYIQRKSDMTNKRSLTSTKLKSKENEEKEDESNQIGQINKR